MTAELRRLAARVVAPAGGDSHAGGFHTELAWSELLEYMSGVSRFQLSGLLTRRAPTLLPYESTGADLARVLAGYRDDITGGGPSTSPDVAGRFDTALDEVRGLGRLADAGETGPTAVTPTQVTPVAVTTATPYAVEDPLARHEQLTQVATVLAAVTARTAGTVAAASRPDDQASSTWRPYQPATPEQRARRKRQRAQRAQRAPATAKTRHYVRSVALVLVAFGLCRTGFPAVDGPADLVLPGALVVAAAILTMIPAIPRGLRIVTGVLPGVLLVASGTHEAVALPLAVRFAAFVAGLVLTTVYIAVASQPPLGRPKPTGD